MAPSIIDTAPASCCLPTIKTNGIQNVFSGSVMHNDIHPSIPASANPSLQVTADHRIKLVPATVYSPGPGEVLVHVRATGICGSDVHFWKTGAIGSLVVEGDCILGHEGAGVVIECGTGVHGLVPGDRVAIEPGVPCGTCYLCMNGRYNLCEEVKFAGVYPHQGTLQRYKVHLAKWLHKIPPTISFAEAALLEPLSVTLHGINTARIYFGRPALVCGAGPIGLIALAIARASGAHPLVITDVAPQRLEFAKSFIPSCQTYLIDTTRDAQSNATSIRTLFGNTEYECPDVVLECTGVESSIVTAAYTARRGGNVMVIGVGKPLVTIPFMHLSLAEINLKFINRYHDTWPAGIAALNGGLVDLKKLVTHVFPLEKAVEAMELCSDVRNGSVKVQIVDGDDM